MNDELPPLPEFDPHPDLWARIESDLQAGANVPDASFRRAIEQLPIHEPKLDLWDAIDDELTTPVVVRPLWQTRWVQWGSVAAAAMLVLIGGWLLLTTDKTEQVRMEYAVEQSAKPTPTDDLFANPMADQRAEEFIRQQCAEQQLACQRPAVHELRNQLTELTNEQQRLTRERQVFGDDPALIRAQVQVENQRIDVMKELITMLRS